MKPFVFRLAVVLSAAAVIAVAYLAGAMGVGAGEDVGWPMVADATVVDFGTSLGTAEAVRVVSYDEGALLCVNQASAQACTTQGAEAPMLAFVDAPTGSSVVVVDPRGRIVGLRMTDLAGVVQDVPSDICRAPAKSVIRRPTIRPRGSTTTTEDPVGASTNASMGASAPCVVQA